MGERLVIAAAADLHLNISKYKGVTDNVYVDTPFRHADFMNSFSWIIDKITNDIKPDLFVIPGDVVDHHIPTNILRGFFSEQLQKLVSCKIPVLILIGNHDVCSRSHALEDISKLKLKNIVVVEEPKVLKFKGTNLILFPYSMEVEKGNISIKEQFVNFINKTKENKDNSNSLFFGHFGVNGAKINEYDIPKDVDKNCLEKDDEEKFGFINRNSKDINLKDLDSIGSDYVILGDYHQHQRLKTEKCYAMYTGSIERTDVSEADHKKGFIVYDSEAEEIKDGLGKCRFIEYPDCRPMLEISGTLKEMKSKVEKTIPYDKRPIVKVSFVGNSQEKMDFNIGFDSLKKDIFKKFNPIHFFHTLKTIGDKVDEEAQEIQDEIMEKGKAGSIALLDVIFESIKEKFKEEESECEAVTDLAKEIDDSVINS